MEYKPRDARPTRRSALTTRFMFPAVAVAWLLSAPAVSIAQDADVRPLLDRIERLERDIRTLNRQLSRGEAPPLSEPAPLTSGGGDMPPAAAARINSRLSTLEQDLRTMTGRNEELGFRLEQVEERLDKLIGDIDYRLSALEQGAGPAGQPGSAGPAANAPLSADDGGRPPAPQAEGTLGTIPRSALSGDQAEQPGGSQTPASDLAAADATLPEGTPQEQYAHARKLLFSQQDVQAEAAFESFIEQHPDHALTPNARYWLGETYYVRKDYAQAAQTFLQGYQADPDGVKAPDTLLKLGMSLANLDKQQEACATLSKLRADFPNASETIRNLAERERTRGNCP